jgi:SAM-dependent methyltransferase
MSQERRPDVGVDLQAVYRARFEGQEKYRADVWRILLRDWFSRYISRDARVLDLGCGYCEFINQVTAGERFAMDLNPAVRDRVTPGVTLFAQDCSQPWPLRDESLDVVFTSNFLEHLQSKESISATLAEARRCLSPGGKLIAMGPNVKFVTGAYWDFFDHYLPLTEESVGEAMGAAGFRVTEKVARFLPYTMSHGFRPPAWTVAVYLRVPIMWRLAGKQFLVVGEKR